MGSTTALGDWYFKILFTRPQHLLLAVSGKSRLPVVLPARELSTMTIRFQGALERVLDDLGVPASAIAAELGAMNDVSFAKTIDRRVLGSLNDFGHCSEDIFGAWARASAEIILNATRRIPSATAPA